MNLALQAHPLENVVKDAIQRVSPPQTANDAVQEPAEREVVVLEPVFVLPPLGRRLRQKTDHAFRGEEVLDGGGGREGVRQTRLVVENLGKQYAFLPVASELRPILRDRLVIVQQTPFAQRVNKRGNDAFGHREYVEQRAVVHGQRVGLPERAGRDVGFELAVPEYGALDPHRPLTLTSALQQTSQNALQRPVWPPVLLALEQRVLCPLIARNGFFESFFGLFRHHVEVGHVDFEGGAQAPQEPVDTKEEDELAGPGLDGALEPGGLLFAFLSLPGPLLLGLLGRGALDGLEH